MSPASWFAAPAALPLLLLVPLAWLALHAGERARARRLARSAGPRFSLLADTQSPGRRLLRRVLTTFGLLAAILALLQPLGSESTGRLEQRGVDLLVCLDVSQSMLARDLEPSRLVRARQQIRALAERARGDRLGLVVFAGEARLMVPLTRDMGSYLELVETADPLSVRRGGTDPGAALEAALAALPDQGGEHQAILLLSDGEDHQHRGLELAARCKERQVTVHSVGFGSARGGKIPVDSPSGETFLQDDSGQEVITALNPADLQAIAAATGGEYLDAGSRPQALVDLYDQRVLPMARVPVPGEKHSERNNRYQGPLLAAFLLWLLEFSLSDRKKK